MHLLLVGRKQYTNEGVLLDFNTREESRGGVYPENLHHLVPQLISACFHLGGAVNVGN